MVRTQVQLTEEQAAAVKRLAMEHNISQAEVLRRCVDDYIARNGRSGRDEIWERARAAVGFIKNGPTDMAARHDDYLAEAYEE
ncbi:MAG: CopG family transcriptional regulator [Armatimonadetes bacterium]|nr:CopG family transcriptional regulator [Armatimonadota bacterium]